MALAAAISIGGSAAAQKSSRPADHGRRSIEVGVYDPDGAFKDTKGIAIEHVYVAWENADVSALELADKYAASRNRRLMITVEPWSWAHPERTTPDKLRAAIMAGRHDAALDEICAQIAKLRRRVLVRWGHEMDLSSGRYPWSNWKPQDYIAAYRHVVDRCRRSASNVTYVWSPRGEAHMNDYYPGASYVDVVGLSIFGLQAYDKNAYGEERNFVDLLRIGYDAAKAHKKPVMVAEFGCSGDQEYLKRCGDISQEALSRYPLLTSIVFYSRTETADWPETYGRPDWRISPQSPHFAKAMAFRQKVESGG